MNTKPIYQRENITRAIWALVTEGNSLRERVASGYRYLLRSDYTGTGAEGAVRAILEIAEKIDHGDWSGVSDDEIRAIADRIIELALNRDAWIAA